MHRTRSLPLVRLTLIQPFVEELDRLRIDTDAILSANGLARASVTDPVVFVPIMVINRFLENAAALAGDPYLGIHVGEKLDIAAWPPFIEAVSSAATLGEFFLHFIRAAQGEASTAYHLLEAGAVYSHFREVRTCKQEITPAQNDGFTLAYCLRLLRLGAGTRWQSDEVRATVSDPAAVPKNYQGVTVFGGGSMGIDLRFPTTWLLQAIDPSAMMKGLKKSSADLQIPVDFRDALHQVIKFSLDNPKLDVALVARLSGISLQVLQRKLRAVGTNISREITSIKEQRACKLLTETDKPVAAIATEVGFTNATSFTRAFKSWTGESPRDYRRNTKHST